MLGWGGTKKKEKLIKLNTKQTEKRSPFDFRPRNNPHSANFLSPSLFFFTLPTVSLIPLDTVFISIFISMAWYGTWHGMAHTFRHSPCSPFLFYFCTILSDSFSYFSLGFSSLIFAYVFSFESTPTSLPPANVPLFCFLRTFAFCVSFVADDDASYVCVCVCE